MEMLTNTTRWKDSSILCVNLLFCKYYFLLAQNETQMLRNVVRLSVDVAKF